MNTVDNSKDKVSYLPFAQGSVSYHACFNDLHDGLQTHIYAPLGLEIQGKWSVGGRLPGEPKPLAEPGINTPRHGLYIREDVRMTCSSLLLAFVRRTFKDSHARLVEKLVERAHILESNFANERLQALRSVDPGERMGHGDIFIAPPPDYECTGQVSQVPSPRYPTHLRCHSDPVLSPGFSSSSTLNGQNSNMLSPSKGGDRPISLRFVLEERSRSSSAPAEPNLFFLPSTTYTNNNARRISRTDLLSPNAQTERMISLLPCSPRLSQENLNASQQGCHSSEEHCNDQNIPHLSYSPEDAPLSFTLSFDPQSPFDKRSTSESSSSSQHLLDDIDDAIDEVFKYTATPATKNEEVQENKLASLPTSTTMSDAASMLTKATCAPIPKRERKDSVVPLHEYVDKELPALPPAPLKDEKWRRQLGL